MKKRFQALIVSIILLLSMSVNSTVFAEDNITVKLNGEILLFDVPPQFINGRTMVPMRTIFEKLGASIDWDDATQTITSVKDDTTIRLTIGVPSIKINQQIPKDLDAAPCVVEGRTLVPIRAISEAFHMNVDWDNATQTVLVTPPNVNMTAYNKLKNIILAKDTKLSAGGEGYSIFYRPQGENYFLMLAYQPTYEYISEYLGLFYQWEGNIEDTVMISLYPDINPSLSYIREFSSGNEYKLYADYPKANQPFVETTNTFPKNWASYEELNINMALMDVLMQDMVNMSLSDFGLYYEKPHY